MKRRESGSLPTLLIMGLILLWIGGFMMGFGVRGLLEG